MAADKEQSGKGGKILLTGDISKVFLDTDAIWEQRYVVQENILDAIETAAKEEFTVIGVSLSGTASRIAGGIKALHEVNTHAKIVLLAQMYEEPIAIKLIETANNGQKVIDDYLICPVDLHRLDEAGGAEKAEISDRQMEKRIRELERLATEDDRTHRYNA